MLVPTIRGARALVFVTVVSLFVLYWPADRALAAVDYCDDMYVCNGGVPCETECYYAEHPNGWITCGEFGGPAYGTCTGECGDSYCDTIYLEEDAENCWWDCGECGDSICSEEPEMWAQYYCCQDCGSCGYEYDYCVDNGECEGGLGCNYASHCCTSIPVTSCGYCDAWEDCVNWYGGGDYSYLCVTKGAACDGLT